MSNSNDDIGQVVSGNGNIFAGQGDVYVVKYDLPPVEPADRRNLLLLLEKVENFWVDGVLKQSLHEEVLLALGMELKPDAVAHPWERVLELPDHSKRSLHTGESTPEIFERVGRLLLILGEPGSGKTTVLLEVARALIARAREDPKCPVPVVLNLSTWSNRRQRLVEWLERELQARYQIPARLSRGWIAEGRLLFLLDGLDEVKRSAQESCIQAINDFGRSVLLPGLLVCSRLQEYMTLSERLKLSAAVVLQPLSREQIHEYLEAAGSRLDALRVVLEDPEWYALAESPLMLSVMSLAYRDLPVNELKAGRFENIDARRSHTFEVYIQRMFERKPGAKQRYSQQQMRKWLSWLARSMNERSQTVFSIEQLQPNWVSTNSCTCLYYLSTRITTPLIILAVSITFALCIHHFASLNYAHIPLSPQTYHRLLTTAILVGTTLGALEFWRHTLPKNTSKIGLAELFLAFTFATTSLDILLNSPGHENTIAQEPVRTFLSLFYLWLCTPDNTTLPGRDIGPIGLGTSQVHPPTHTSIKKPLDNPESPRPAEPYASRKKTGFKFSASLSKVPISLINSTALTILLTTYFVYTHQFSIIIFFLLYSSLSHAFALRTQLAIEKNVRPGHVIHSWLRTSASIIIATMVAMPITVSLLAQTQHTPSPHTPHPFAIGFFAAWFAMLLGGYDTLKHYLLRNALAREGSLPYRAIPFLDHATRLVFMRRIGGSYAFIHRLLLEHFATHPPLEEASRTANLPHQRTHKSLAPR